MKIIAFAFISLFSLSAFSANVKTTVENIEFDRNARCSKVKEGYKFCFGFSVDAEERRTAPCRYTVTYSCYSNTEDFTVKLKVKESYNSYSDRRVENVTKVSYGN